VGAVRSWLGNPHRLLAELVAAYFRSKKRIVDDLLGAHQLLNILYLRP
jgi:hypothetical protein